MFLRLLVWFPLKFLGLLEFLFHDFVGFSFFLGFCKLIPLALLI